jgi:hypothetical protein
MSGLAMSIVGRLRRALDAVEQELRLLEQDLGLCAECAERRPPPPLGRGTVHSIPAHTPMITRERRVA